MIWIVSSDSDIAGNAGQLAARHRYIEEVTSSVVSPWRYQKVNPMENGGFLCCFSSEGLRGTFITAHIAQVSAWCMIKEIYNSEIIVANTCIWARWGHKRLLKNLMNYNTYANLWFAKQGVDLDRYRTFHKVNTLQNIGSYGFITSKSERLLYKNRHLDLREAIMTAFDKVYPIDLLSD